MLEIPKEIIYAIPEEIGDPQLFVGRKKEFDYFLGEWLEYVKKGIARSHAIVARRKKGKTAFLERYYNILWTLHDPQVIPFFFSYKDRKMRINDFTKEFVLQLLCQLIAYEKKEVTLIRNPVSFLQLSTLTKDEIYCKYPRVLEEYERSGNCDLMWETASRAPWEIAIAKGVKIIQIFDEFQNIDGYVTDSDGNPSNTMSGVYLTLAQKRQAPVIVSGSEVHGLLEIVNKLVGRFWSYRLENLPRDEADEAVEQYAKVTSTVIAKQTKKWLWNLTSGDPLYIGQLFLSRHNAKKDYTHIENITDVYEKEISPRGGIFDTWAEYLGKVFAKVNQENAKRMMLYLFNVGEERTQKQIIDDLKLTDDEWTVQKKLLEMTAADLMSEGSTKFRYSISPDKTYELIFRKLFQEEIDTFVPNIQAELKKQMGLANVEKGLYGEFLLRKRIKDGFNLQKLSYNGPDIDITPKGIEERKRVRLGLKEYEIDLVVRSKPEIWIEVKQRTRRYGKADVEKMWELKEALKGKRTPPILAVYSESGYTKDTQKTLEEIGIVVIDPEAIKG